MVDHAKGRHLEERRPERRRRAGDVGQVVLLMAGVLALVAALAVGLVMLGNLISHRAHAQTAADAAALAGAAEGRLAARQVALENDGELQSFVIVGSEVEVTVQVGDSKATSRARREW